MFFKDSGRTHFTETFFFSQQHGGNEGLKRHRQMELEVENLSLYFDSNSSYVSTSHSVNGTNKKYELRLI
jgi:hypothetical protein